MPAEQEPRRRESSTPASWSAISIASTEYSVLSTHYTLQCKRLASHVLFNRTVFYSIEPGSPYNAMYWFVYRL